jgi:hypothetical protein
MEYLHHSPASCTRQQEENLVPGGITGPPCHWGTYIKKPGIPGWGLDARLTTLLSKKMTAMKSKDRKTGLNLAEYSKEGYSSKRAVVPMMIMMIF